MSKFVFLELDGDLDKGFRVTLEIQEDEQIITRQRGSLNPNPELSKSLQEHWLKKYRNLRSPARRNYFRKFFRTLKPISIDNTGSITIRDECKKSAKQLPKKVNKWLKEKGFYEV